MDYGYFWHDPKSVRLICSSVICLKRSYPVQRRRCVFNRTCLVFKINCGSKIENVKETQAVQLRTLQVWTCRPRPPPPFHLTRTRWDDARSRGQSEQTRNEDGDESGAAVSLCKLFPRSASLLCGRAACGEPPAVESRLRADTAHSLRLVLR